MKKSIIAAVIAAAMAPAAQAGDVTIKLGSGIKAADKEKELKFQVGGRLMWDYNYAEREDNGVIQDGSTESDIEARRARIFVKTSVGDWQVKSQFNVGDGSPEDLYLRYNGFGKAAKITIGRQKESIGLEELTSSKDITFLERSATTELFAQGRNTGIQVSGDIDNFHYDFGVFEDEIQRTDDDDTEASRLAVTARAAYAFKSDESLLHLGVSHTSRSEQAPEANADSTDFHMTRATGIELAGVLGSFHGQAEFFDGELVEELPTATERDVDGFYVQLGYIVTGESRPYKGGKFKRVKPADGGAMELVVRYTDGHGIYSDTEISTLIGDREGEEIGVGFNYYANNNVRLGLTYSEAERSDDVREGSELRARAQLVF